MVSGLVGALLVFLLGRFLDSRREKRELRGHLALLSSEMLQNAVVLDAYRENPELMRRERAASLREDVWAAARARVAQLAHPAITAKLATYYRSLGSARRAAEGWKAEDDPFASPTVLFDHLEFARKDAEKAMDGYAPIKLGGPLSTIFAWLERRGARRGW